MIPVQNKVDLKPYNTFGLEVTTRYFAEIFSESDFIALQQTDVYKTTRHLIIGGGSNILLLNDFDGLVIKNCIKGITSTAQADGSLLVKAGAGEVWHDFVLFTIEKGWAGLENLSLIPGCVGASPMQNIGAYGVEIKDCFYELEALHVKTGEKRIFSKQECRFGYRESIFKQEEKGNYFITSVTFALKREAVTNTSYGAINDELNKMGVQQPGIRDVSQAVINIRRSKLPDPLITGNAGSFFKNPEVNKEVYERIREKHENVVAYPLSNGKVKLAAGWLIENCGLKGYERHGAAVHAKQALVLINKQNATGKAIYELSAFVMQTVFDTFGVELEREVNIIT
ncbi:MAG: UDP-N-acetylmuramate dehydrogenase [Sediminibacterium sp.]|nr:UDP-N-acetylmuramate dehydrogenase [Sediminibacterium sp.]